MAEHIFSICCSFQVTVNILSFPLTSNSDITSERVTPSPGLTTFRQCLTLTEAISSLKVRGFRSVQEFFTVLDLLVLLWY